MRAKLFDRCVLEVRVYPVNLAGGEIDATHVGAVRFAIDIFVGMRLLPRAFRYRCDVVIAEGLVVVRNQATTQLTDHFAFFDFYGSKQAVPAIGNQRFLYHCSFIVFPVYF
jgi:hypothetical protein